MTDFDSAGGSATSSSFFSRSRIMAAAGASPATVDASMIRLAARPCRSIRPGSTSRRSSDDG